MLLNKSFLLDISFMLFKDGDFLFWAASGDAVA